MADLAKPAFDPTKKFEPVAAAQKPAFDPNAKFEPVQANQNPGFFSLPNISEAELKAAQAKGLAAQEGARNALTKNALNSVLLGYLPQVSAGIKSVIPGFGSYGENLAKEKESLNQLQAQNPGESMLGSFGGTMLPGGAISKGLSAVGALPGISKAVQGVSAAEKIPGLVGAVSRIGSSALQGGLAGGVYGLAQNPDVGPVQEQKSRIENAEQAAKFGSLAGAGFQGFVEALKGAGSAGQSLMNYAREKAFKSLGPDKTKLSQPSIISGKEQAIGQSLLDNNVVGTIPRGYKVLAEKANEAVEHIGSQLEDKINQIADHAKNMAGPSGQAGVSRQALADQLEKELVESHMGVPTLRKDSEKLLSWINDFRQGGDDLIDINNAQRLKQTLGAKVNWKRLPQDDVPLHEAFNRALYHATKQGIENAAESVAQSMNSNFAKEYITLKNEYGNLKTAAAIANKRAAGEMVNRYLSPSDYGVGLFSAAIMHSNPATAIGHAALGALANKGARQYGNQILARSSYSLGQRLQNNLPELGQTFSNFPVGAIGAAASNPQLDAIQRRTQNASNR